MSAAPNHFASYISDALVSFIAGSEDCADFIVRQGEDEIVYIEVESGSLYLITVREAQVHVGGSAEGDE